MNYLKAFKNDSQGSAGINSVLFIFVVAVGLGTAFCAVNGYEMKTMKDAWNLVAPKVERGIVSLTRTKEV